MGHAQGVREKKLKLCDDKILEWGGGKNDLGRKLNQVIQIWSFRVGNEDQLLSWSKQGRTMKEQVAAGKEEEIWIDTNFGLFNWPIFL